MTTPPYDREVLVEVLVYHYRKSIEGCGCGWAELGASHPEHVADVYEESVTGEVLRGDRRWSPCARCMGRRREAERGRLPARLLGGKR